MKLFKHFTCIAAILLFSGCATTQNSAFDASVETLDFSANSYFILAVEIDHAVKPSFNPNTSLVLHIELPEADEKSERFNVIARQGEFVNIGGKPPFVYFRGALPPGDYIVRGISGTARKFPIVGTFSIPMASEFKLNPNEVIYLGKLRARTRERKEGEFRAGPVIPLLDQSVSKFAGSTFDILLLNDSETDIAWMKQTYPAMRNQAILTKALPEYDRSLFDDEGTVSEPVTSFEDTQNNLPTPENILNDLNSEDSAKFRLAAIDINQQKLYGNKDVVNASTNVLERAISNDQEIKDASLIDGLAWCVINLGATLDESNLPILEQVIASELPKKVKEHAEASRKKLSR